MLAVPGRRSRRTSGSFFTSLPGRVAIIRYALYSCFFIFLQQKTCQSFVIEPDSISMTLNGLRLC